MSVRGAFLLAAVLLLGGLGWVVLADEADPLARSCAPELEQAACDSAIEAVLRRGLDSLHPLITAAHVEPGSAPGPQDSGHRATVTFDLLLMPEPTAVELYYDVGAHWGGETERSEVELTAWALLPLALAALAAAVVTVRAGRRRATD